MSRRHTASSRYQSDASNIAKSRGWAVDELRRHADADERLLADVELVLSELMTNALKAGATEVSVTLEASSTAVIVSVQDDAAGTVAIRTAGPTALGGRGLPIVAALSTDWGVEARPPGKRVWAALPTSAR